MCSLETLGTIPTSLLVFVENVFTSLVIYRSRWRDNGRLYAVPKFYRHTASVSRGQINPIDPLAGTSRWDLNPIDPLPGTTRGCVQHE